MTEIQRALRALENYKKELDKSKTENVSQKVVQLFLEATIKRLKEGYYDDKLVKLQKDMTQLGFRSYNRNSPIITSLRDVKRSFEV